MILYDAGDGIARITLNRPEKRNALSSELLRAVREGLARAAADESVRVVTIAGAGKDFCAGADLASLSKEGDVLSRIDDAREFADLFLAVRNHPRPVVALVKGRAFAGGCGLATVCDIVLAAESAQFGYSEVNVGLVPAMVTSILTRSVSEKRAFELLSTGEMISATRAETIGMINRVWPDADFDDAAHKYVTALAAKPPSAVALSKNLLHHIDGMAFNAALEAGVHVNAIARQTEDAQRGIQRFLKKG